jgi:hypothetical protein
MITPAHRLRLKTDSLFQTKDNQMGAAQFYARREFHIALAPEEK